jgi:hypothetical protein
MYCVRVCAQRWLCLHIATDSRVQMYIQYTASNCRHLLGSVGAFASAVAVVAVCDLFKEFVNGATGVRSFARRQCFNTRFIIVPRAYYVDLLCAVRMIHDQFTLRNLSIMRMRVPTTAFLHPLSWHACNMQSIANNFSKTKVEDTKLSRIPIDLLEHGFSTHPST